MKLVGNKVILRSIEQQDLPVLWDFIYGEDVPEWKKWDGPYFPLEKESIEEFKVSMAKHMQEASLFAIEVNGKLVGTTTYYWEYKPTRWLEVGIIIYDPNYWSDGYGTDALILWVTEMFKRFPIERVGLTTWSGNERMMKSAEKLGMKLEGRLRKCRYHNGIYYDSIKMGVLRDEWEQLYNVDLSNIQNEQPQP
ncbi:GNAT family N-acetyltransferase [Cytobacillus sp. Hm23]